VGSNPTPRTIFEHPAIDEILTKYLNYLLCKKSLKPATIKRKVKTIKSLLKHGVELPNPDNVIAFLNPCSWASGTKDITIDAYRDYLNMLGLTEVKLPHIRREETLPFVPLEEELDSVISSVRTKMATFLRVLKDTGARPIEAWTLKWTDVSTTGKCVTITPAKYSHARKLGITEQTLNMLLVLPKKNQYVFSPSGQRDRFADELEHFAINFVKARTRVANKMQNPRIRLISLRTFRHWKATMLYHRTKDILFVKESLGHVNIQNTLRYIHLANAVATIQGEYTCKAAKTVKEASELIENGFEYICELDDARLFRKRK
jgi:integrase